MKPVITILIVNFNSADFINVSLYSLQHLTKNNYKVFILDNNSKLKDFNKLKKICSDYKNVFLERNITPLEGSLAHGTALNYLVKKVDTPYFSILDADAVWLKKNWDAILIGKITEKVKVIGSQAPKPKPQDFPLMFAILFETKTFKKLSVDFRPKRIESKQDTGYDLRKKFLKKKFKGEIIVLKNTREYKKGPFKDLIVAEYYLKEDCKNLFASHFGRGSTMGVIKYTGGKGVSIIYKIPFLSKPLRYLKGTIEKKKWIKICMDIIKKETHKKGNVHIL
ncbi:TPA: glycosyltransferase family 2 protein [Candidatus Woesearchaeota archaeon]|nr:glycosyltransferase family 2 protein [Candidatus Woesearchaeota archaeon]HIH54273.1 glycosyltransferase family 2 protein [Candidatus Woesearchaeota archaeon]HIJ02537.1 glycosyltransferase family 2 protein [Candidatus Woesearchaeota archaeon]HIJ13417.1 glycosyltransferase family 2 protein [Candidatus Woesearchaeota archaeon]